ncbi:MAG TPA: VOC family protein [Candidatus Limnocylindria bacterium]|nr:VOC family protein [Candidatus Limnocylindria bacterium]
MPARLNPYLSFQGNAREAMEFYRDVLGGELTVTTFAEGGLPHGPDEGDKVMHAQLETPTGFTLMASDAVSTAPAPPSSGVQVSLSGDRDADAELSGYFDKLAAKGQVVEPLEEAPWGDKFGMVADPYGVLWLVNIGGAQQPGG